MLPPVNQKTPYFIYILVITLGIICTQKGHQGIAICPRRQKRRGRRRNGNGTDVRDDKARERRARTCRRDHRAI
jgi:hypothetical protein